MATAYIALGSNEGDSRATILRAFEELERLSQRPIARSSLWRASPVDCPPGSPEFINAVAGITTLKEETPETLLGKLQEIERKFGRRPKQVHNEPRPLDLDIIAFDGEVRNTGQLVLPHPRAHLRQFVLQPLAEIAPGLVLPGQSLSVASLLTALKSSEQIARVQ